MDKEEFAEVVWDARNTLYRVAKSILKSGADCEDAVSQAILNAFEHLDSLKKPQYAKTWLVRIVLNECYRMSRELGREQCYEEAVICIGEWTEGGIEDCVEGQYTELYEALLKLPQKHHTALVLYYLEGYSMAEIAQIEKTSVGNVKMRLSRGRKMLSELLKNDSKNVKKFERMERV